MSPHPFIPTQQPYVINMHINMKTHRYYTKSHATIESEMEGWVNRLDESMDSAPLVRWVCGLE